LTVMPLISIIIPVFNAEKTLCSCMQSIITQSFKDFEIIIIDGVSVDESLTIIIGYAAKYPFIKWISEEDNGIYDAMNKGVTKAKGDYLYFLGSDDTLFNEFVLSAIAERLKESNAKIWYGNVMMSGDNQWLTESTIHAGEFDLKRLISHNICHQSIVYHHSIFSETGCYNIGYPVFADYDFNLRCFARYQFVHDDIIVANFKIGGRSTTLTDDKFEEEKIANIIHYYIDKLASKPFIELRLYIKQAALSSKVKISFGLKLYCLLVYAKLKTQALLN
jgi:glycosyltransferase involved in cell wall biosynthesis